MKKPKRKAQPGRGGWVDQSHPELLVTLTLEKRRRWKKAAFKPAGSGGKAEKQSTGSAITACWRLPQCIPVSAMWSKLLSLNLHTGG